MAWSPEGRVDFKYADLFQMCSDSPAMVRTSGQDPAQVRIYESDYSIMKYDREGQRQPFISRGVTLRHMPSIPEMPKDTFVVIPDGRNSQKKTYIVSSVRKTIAYGSAPVVSIVTGDHYSFLLNRGDKRGKDLQFHRTEHVPLTDEKGVCVHFANHLQSRFPLKNLPDLVEDDLEDRSKEIVALFSAPYTNSTSETQLEGGANSRRRRQREYRRLPRRQGETLADVWRRLPLHRIIVIALPSQENLFDVTVFVHDRLRHQQSVRNGFYMKDIDAGLLRHEEALQTLSLRSGLQNTSGTNSTMLPMMTLPDDPLWEGARWQGPIESILSRDRWQGPIEFIRIFRRMVWSMKSHLDLLVDGEPVLI